MHANQHGVHRKWSTIVSWAGPPPARQVAAAASNSPSAQDEMQDKSDDRKNQQQMDESTGHMKYCEATKPRDQQNDKQNRPDAHVLSFV
jgi:hypothetical protein